MKVIAIPDSFWLKVFYPAISMHERWPVSDCYLFRRNQFITESDFLMYISSP